MSDCSWKPGSAAVRRFVVTLIAIPLGIEKYALLYTYSTELDAVHTRSL